MRLVGGYRTFNTFFALATLARGGRCSIDGVVTRFYERFLSLPVPLVLIVLWLAGVTLVAAWRRSTRSVRC
jgi:hypothetical protein